jgi:hypothetical protein
MPFKKTMTDEERFWVNVNKTETCWLWTAGKTKQGYGKFWFDGKRGRAHRYAFILFNGSIPDGLLVCHSCDVRACVNPKHLWLGTHSDNSADMHRKNRQPPQNKPKTHCRKGHEYAVLGTWIAWKKEVKNADGTITTKVYRKCRECVRTYEKNRLSDPAKGNAHRKRVMEYNRRTRSTKKQPPAR